MDSNDISLVVIFRGSRYTVSVQPTQSIRELITERIQPMLALEPDTIKLIVKSMTISLNDNSAHQLDRAVGEIVKPGDKVMVMGTDAETLREMQKPITENKNMLGFVEEMERARRRSEYAPRSIDLSEVYFERFDTLQQFTDPPPARALRLLQTLATDPGILAVMKKHKWKVGVLNELPPEGYVGVSDVCLLGLNTNHGQIISLRLRTDDKKGFRNYETIKDVLLHELTHNVWGDHDENFFKLYRQLQKEARDLDWTKSKGHNISGVVGTSSNSDSFNIQSRVNNTPLHEDKGKVLGGTIARNIKDARLQALQTDVHKTCGHSHHHEETPQKMEVDTHFPDLTTTIGGTVITAKENTKTPAVNTHDVVAAKTTNTGSLSTSQKSITETPQPQNWPCDRCTFSNPPSKTVCEACDKPREQTAESNDVDMTLLSSDPQLSHVHNPVTEITAKLEHELNRLVASCGGPSTDSAQTALHTLHVIMDNILKQPDQMKFRSLPLDTALGFYKRVGRFDGGVQALQVVGFKANQQGTHMVLERNDLGLLWLAKSAVQDKLEKCAKNQVG